MLSVAALLIVAMLFVVTAFGTDAATPTDLKTKLEIGWNGLEKVFDGKAATPDASITNTDDLIESHTDVKVVFTIAKGGEAVTEATAAGEYTLTASLSGKDVEYYTIGSGETATLKISKKTITVTPKAEQSKVYGDEEPTLAYTLDDDSFSNEVTGTLSREEGEDVGDYKIKQGMLSGSDNVEIVFTEDVVFAVTPKALTLKAENAGKNFGAKDPEELTVEAVGLANNDTLEDLAYEVSRETGEKVGEYAIKVEAIEGEGKNANYTIDTSEDGTFTISGEFAGTVSVVTDPLTTRTTGLELKVEGISADLSDATLTLYLKAGKVEVSKDNIKEDDTIELEITGHEETDPVSGKSFTAYLPEGDYFVEIKMPQKAGEAVTAKGPDIKVSKDSLEITVSNSNAVNEARSLIGKETADTLISTLKEFQVNNPKTDDEIIQLTINDEAKYIKPGDMDKELEALITKLKEQGGVDQIPVKITAWVATPDLNSTAFEKTYMYDPAYKDAVTKESISGLNNRTSSFTVKFPEPSRITEISLSGFNTVDVNSIKYSGVDGADEYGTTATIPVSFATGNPPRSYDVEVTIKYVDAAGNTAPVYTQKGIDQGVAKQISVNSIEPRTSSQEGKLYLQGTNAIRLSGYATASEQINISITDSHGKRLYSKSITVEGVEGENWKSDTINYWTVTIGDDDSEENLELPVGEPLTLRVNYGDVMGGSAAIILIYDEVCQEAQLLTPLYPRMKILTGYTENGSSVTATWGNGSQEATVTSHGFFTIVFPEEIFDPELILEITDIAGNTLSRAYEIPGRRSDVEMKVPAYPIGAMIEDEIGNTKFIATPVLLDELQNGDIEIPILAANYFKVGTMTISRGEDGKVSFDPVIDPAYAIEGANSFFNVFSQKPAADAMDAENRGNGMQITDGYTPEDNTEVFWFVYEVEVNLTEDQLLLQGDPATVDLISDDQYNAFQAMAAE